MRAMSDRDLVVSTAYGKVRGLREGGVALWRGIPYAEPPLGALRFLPPRPAVPWTDERDATRFGPVACQSRDPGSALFSEVTADTPMSEDCLSLNVWSPAADGARRPVAVWIHGGAFIIGSGAQPLYDGRSFAARHDIVVVTINYRLGLLGMLYLGDLAGEAYRRGNVALLDQIAALRWVRENIAAFGGDPARVTVMGESAGAIAIGNLLGMPEARGLFHRAILQSGGPILVPPVRADATARARDVLAGLGVGAAGLAEVPVERLLAAQMQIYLSRGPGAITPYLDGESIPRRPIEAVRDGSAAGIPLLVGSNRDEWRLFDVLFGEASTSAARASYLERVGDDLLRVHAAYRDARAARPAGAAGPAGARAPEVEAWIDLLGDAALRMPVLRLADAQAGHAPVWMYRFDWETPALEGRLGAAHALELPFVWNQLDLPFAQRLLGGGVEDARRLGAQMHGAWAAFIRGGAPAADGLPAWPRHDEPRRATMVLDREPRVADDPDRALREVWSGIPRSR